MHSKIILLSILLKFSQGAPAIPSLNILSGPNGPLIHDYLNAITAYGPGLGIYSPYSYVDVSYDNIPFVGKIPLIGKDGTSSRLGISPFYPPGGNPSNPWPPIYRARPLPLHVPEPQDVVAVPLDEEALHGEPLFPPELTLPIEKEAETAAEKKAFETAKPENPFEDVVNEESTNGVVSWPEIESEENAKIEKIIDEAQEKPMKPFEASKIIIGENDRPRSPFRSRRILVH